MSMYLPQAIVAAAASLLICGAAVYTWMALGGVLRLPRPPPVWREALTFAAGLASLWGLLALLRRGRRPRAEARSAPVLLRWLVCGLFAVQQAILLRAAAALARSTPAARLLLFFLPVDLPALGAAVLVALAARGSGSSLAERVFLALAPLSAAGKFVAAWAATLGCTDAASTEAGGVGAAWWWCWLLVGLSLSAAYGLLSGWATSGAATPRRYLSVVGPTNAVLFLLHFTDALAMCAAVGHSVADCGGAEVPRNVQFLMLFFSVTGIAGVTVYSALMFFTDVVDPTLVAQGLAEYEGPSPGACRTNQDATMHFFVWTLLLVDLPYSSLRVVAWMVRGAPLSPLVAKNAVMVAQGLLWLTKPTE